MSVQQRRPSRAAVPARTPYRSESDRPRPRRRTRSGRTAAFDLSRVGSVAWPAASTQMSGRVLLANCRHTFLMKKAGAELTPTSTPRIRQEGDPAGGHWGARIGLPAGALSVALG